MKRERYRKWSNTIWPIRKIGNYPNIYIYVLPFGEIQLQQWGDDGIVFELHLSREHARLLARRIIQALDATQRK